VTVCAEGFACERQDALYWQCKQSPTTPAKPGSDSSRPAALKYPPNGAAVVTPMTAPSPAVAPPPPPPSRQGDQQGVQLQFKGAGNSIADKSSIELPTESCPRDGDADILGLGVRLGVYFSTAALLLPCRSIRTVKEVKAAIASTLPMTISVLAVLTAQVAGGFITDFGFVATMWVLGVYWVALCVPLTWYVMVACTHKHVIPGFTAFVCSGLMLWLFSLQFWFWTIGYKQLHRSACGTTWAFAFGPVDAYAGMRTAVLVAIGLFGALQPPCVLCMLYSFFGMFYVPIKVLQRDAKAIHVLVTAEAHARDSSSLFPVLAVGLILLDVVAGELTMQYNSMQGVNAVVGTGQTLALSSGVVALCLAVHGVVKDWVLYAVGPNPAAPTRPTGRVLHMARTKTVWSLAGY
jgi:hypothetical protein